MIRTELLREIYPDLTIYETPVGQNWQILIPMAGRWKCGYIDEELYHIAVRENSHSRQTRSLREEVERRMGLKEVLEMGIALSGRTDRDYQKIVDLKYQRILMHIYLNAGAAAEAEACYRTLKQEGVLSAEDRRRYLEVLHPVRHRFFLCIELGKRAVRKGIRLLTGK